MEDFDEELMKEDLAFRAYVRGVKVPLRFKLIVWGLIAAAIIIALTIPLP